MLFSLFGIAWASTACKSDQLPGTYCVDLVHSNKRISMFQMQFAIDLIQNDVMEPFGRACLDTCPTGRYQSNNIGNPVEPHIMDIKAASYTSRSHREIFKQAMYRVLNLRTYESKMNPDYFWETKVNYPANIYTEIFKAEGQNKFVLDGFTNIFFIEANFELDCEKDLKIPDVFSDYGYEGPGAALSKAELSVQCIEEPKMDCSLISDGTIAKDIPPDCFIHLIGASFKSIGNNLYLQRP